MRIREVESEKPYRQVEVEPIDEEIQSGQTTEELRGRITAAIQERSEEMEDVPDEVPLSALVDFLTLRMELPHEVMRRLYNEIDPLSRARAACFAIATRWRPSVRQAQDLRFRVVCA